MRCKILTIEKDEIRVNTYTVGLMASGMGKGPAQGLMYKKVLNQFMDKFPHSTMPMLATRNIPVLSNIRAARKGEDPDAVLKATESAITPHFG